MFNVLKMVFKRQRFVLFGANMAQCWPNSDMPGASASGKVESGMVGLAPKWVRLAPNGTNPGLFQIRFQYI